MGTGTFSNQTTRVIDMLDDEFTCELPDYPINMNGGVGGIVEDDVILVCGGYLPDYDFHTDDCLKLTKEDRTWQPAGQLEKLLRGMGSGSIVLNDKLLITGGYDLTSTGEYDISNNVNSAMLINTTDKIEK